jgi:hypothetical protein
MAKPAAMPAGNQRNVANMSILPTGNGTDAHNAKQLTAVNWHEFTRWLPNVKNRATA